MLIKPLTLHTPTSLAEASKLYADLDEVKILAGGTFLMNTLKLLKRKGAKTPQHVISLRKIKELKGVIAEKDKLIIKAMTIINDLKESPELTDNFKILATVCKNISTNPIRNMATLGGNMTCRYTWTEMGAAMIALDADMHFIAADGRDVVMPAEEFFKNAAKTDKIFTHVSIPRDRDARIAYRRIKKTMHVDVPLLTVCIKTNIEGDRLKDTRVTINNGTAFAQRDYVLEDFLNSSRCHEGLAQEAMEHINTEIYDRRSSEYKQHMFRVCLKECINEIMDKK